MARYRGPRVKIVRRLGELPGLTSKIPNRNYPAGQHGPSSGMAKMSQYRVRLQEKQKLRYNYGLTEKQMLSYVKEARRLKGSTGSVLIQLLEMRLDNIVYRLGIGNTIPASRQIVNHGHIYVNNKKVTIPSFQCSPNDTIEIRNKQNSKKLAERFLEQPSYNTIPHYLEFEKETLKGKVKRLAENTETNLQINELLIVEYYSRR